MVMTCARSASRRSTRPTAFAVSPPIPASISSNTSVSPPATAAIASAMRDSSPPEAVSATGPNGIPAFGRMRKTASSAPVAPISRSRISQTNSPSPMPTSCSSAATASANAGAAAFRSARSSMARSWTHASAASSAAAAAAAGSTPPSSAASSSRASAARCMSSSYVDDAEPALRLGDPVEPGLELLQPARLRLERGEERAQLGCGLAQAELDVAQVVAGALELGREPFERRDGPLGERDEPGCALALVRRERVGRRGRSLRELGDVPQSLAVAAQLLLVPVFHPLRVLGERAQLRDPSIDGSRVRGQLLVTAPGRLQLAPCRSHRLAVDPREAVEQLELVRRARQAALLELPGHRDHALDGGGDVLARGRTAPGVCAGPSVREDAARDDERVLVLGPQLRKLVQLGRNVQLRLDVRLVRGRPDERVVRLRPEQEADRLREDRLPSACLPGDRVQARRKLELGRADEDEIVDAQAAQHWDRV